MASSLTVTTSPPTKRRKQQLNRLAHRAWQASLILGIGSCLSAGASKAGVSGTCYFDAFGGSLPGTSCAGYSVKLDDKTFTVVTAPTFGVGKVAFESSPAVDPNLWQTNIDWEGAGIPGPIAGKFEYTAEIDSTNDYHFKSTGLSTGGNYIPGLPNSTITSVVKQGLTSGGPVIDTVTSIDGAANYSQPIGGKQIFVVNSWSIASGDTMDNLSNYITQETPGPLPILGVCAAFGYSRKLRGRIKSSVQA
jgi:hypothetical protein